MILPIFGMLVSFNKLIKYLCAKKNIMLATEYLPFYSIVNLMVPYSVTWIHTWCNNFPRDNAFIHLVIEENIDLLRQEIFNWIIIIFRL